MVSGGMGVTKSLYVGDNFYCGTNGTSPILNILPGYKGLTPDASAVTYDISGVGTHYFWDNVQVTNKFIVGVSAGAA